MSDLISRQAVYDILNNFEFAPPTNNGHDIYNHALADVWEEVADLPSADRPTGKWISQRSKDWRGGGAEICSECGYGYSWGAYHEPNGFKFCPNCGVNMEAKKSD